MKKVLILILCLCLLCPLTLFTGCRDNGTDGPIVDPVKPIEWDKIDWEGKNDSTNVIRVCFSTHFKSYYENIIEEFEAKYPEYDVEPIWAPAGDGVIAQQNTLIGAKDAPDLIMGGDVHILSQVGLLLPLDKLVERDNAEVDVDDFIDEVIRYLHYGENEGKALYYLPDYFNISLLHYNTALFDEAGLDYPTKDWTFADFMEAGKKLTKKEDKNGVTKYTQWGNEFNITWWSQWMTLVQQHGGDVFDENGLVALNTPQAIAAFKEYIDMAGITQKPETWGNKIGAGPSDDDLGKFEGLRTAMSLSGHAGTFEAYNSNPLLEWDIQLLPIGSTGNRVGGELAVNGYGIYYKSNNKKGAWELLKYMTRKRDLAQLKHFNWPAPRKSERDLLISVDMEERRSPKNIEAVYEAIESCVPLPKIEYFSDVVQNKIMPYITKIIEGRMGIEEALAEMTRVANDYITNTYL